MLMNALQSASDCPRASAAARNANATKHSPTAAALDRAQFGSRSSASTRSTSSSSARVHCMTLRRALTGGDWRERTILAARRAAAAEASKVAREVCSVGGIESEKSEESNASAAAVDGHTARGAWRCKRESNSITVARKLSCGVADGNDKCDSKTHRALAGLGASLSIDATSGTMGVDMSIKPRARTVGAKAGSDARPRPESAAERTRSHKSKSGACIFANTSASTRAHIEWKLALRRAR